MPSGVALHPDFLGTRGHCAGGVSPGSIRRWKGRDMPTSSCFTFGAKTYYRPIEAAIRWCGLIRFEQRIQQTLGRRPVPELQDFPRWPLLRLYAERIFDALMYGELPDGDAAINSARNNATGLPEPSNDVKSGCSTKASWRNVR